MTNAGGVRLLFGVHAHQPAGNFDSVVRDAHERCYRPFLHVLHRHPEFPFAIHMSGWLLERLALWFPADLKLLRGMAARGQAEIVGGGDAEPVLAAIPARDRRGQLEALNRRLRKRFGVRPSGAWLTERVWESTVVPALSDAGIRYTMVDDYHFLCTGREAGSLDGYFSTEEDGRRLDLFPISEALRYRFPFAPVGETVAYLEGLRDGAAAIYFDDIEKFGIWPQTYEWVYERRWLEDFIEAVVRSERIQPLRYADYHGSTASRGIVYLPTVSYLEMGEWALPPVAAARYDEIVDRAKREDTFLGDKAFLRGGHWKNFFSRYPESNWMHKRVARASARFHGLPRGRRTPVMLADLHLAQANDAYWHGLFGGIYLPHLRRQVFASLARLERTLDVVDPQPRVVVSDVDLDGREETLMRGEGMLVAIRSHDGSASVCELTHYGLAHNFCDTLARRDEHYFAKVRAREQPVQSDGGGVASIHDRVSFRNAIVDADLAVDRRPRASFLDSFQADGSGSVDVSYVPAPLDAAGAEFAAAVDAIAVEKRYALEAEALQVRYGVRLLASARGAFSVELNLAMPSCDGPGGRLEVNGAVRGGLAEPARVEACARMRLIDDELPGELQLAFSPPALVEMAPLFTVSQSEAGFEKIMQAVTVTATWRLEGDAGAEAAFAVSVRPLAKDVEGRSNA